MILIVTYSHGSVSELLGHAVVLYSCNVGQSGAAGS